MAESITEMLRQDMQCESLLECFHNLKSIDKTVYQLLHQHPDPLTVDAIAQEINRERSTAYRSVQRLLQAGFIEQDQRNYDQGGYYHVYQPRDAAQITQELQRDLNDWYAKMGQLIGEFNDKYATHNDTTITTDS